MKRDVIDGLIKDKMESYTREWYLNEAARYTARAQKHLKRTFLWLGLAGFFKRLFTSADERLDAAKGCYEKAANCYKLGKNCTCPLLAHSLLVEEASAALLRLAELDPASVISTHTVVDAADCMRRHDAGRAMAILEAAVEQYMASGEIRQVRPLARL